MIESTCPHKWDFRSYGTCPMCLKDMQDRHSPNYISTEMLRRIERLSYTNDLPYRYVRMMASELISLRQQIAQVQAPAVEQAQSAAEPVGYISGWINGHLAIRLLDPALALSTGTALFLQPPTVPPAIDDDTKRMVLELCTQVIRNSGECEHIPGTVEAMAAEIIDQLEAGNGE